MKRAVLSLIALALTASAALAHDFWLQPAKFWVEPNETVPVQMLVGDGADREVWGVSKTRIISLQSVGPNGTREEHNALTARTTSGVAAISFDQPGLYVVALESNSALMSLPAARFDAYAREEGLSNVVRHRRAAHAHGPGRETYSRRAKALIQVGLDNEGDHVTRPIGLTLEIVPVTNPYQPHNNVLPVRVFYKGAPLAGARVAMFELGGDQHVTAAHVTDADGVAEFEAPTEGAWMLSVVWSEPIQGSPDADYETIFSSLTFGFPTSETP